MKIRIPILQWLKLLYVLNRKAAPDRGVGAFLLGRNSVVKAVIPYDKLDPKCYRIAGGIEFRGSGKSKLYKICRERKLEIIGDVLGNPGCSPDLSPLAQPMFPVVGYLHLVIPFFTGGLPFLRKHRIGLHEFRGGKNWDSRELEIGLQGVTA